MARVITSILILLALLIGSCLLFGKIFGLAGVLGVTAIFVVTCLFVFYRMSKLLGAINATPEGQTVHAEFFYKHITVGMPLVKIIQIGQALGKKISTTPAIFSWEDGLNRVLVTVEGKNATHIEMISIVNTADANPSTENSTDE